MNSPFFPLDVPFLSDDVVLEALEDDNFVVSSLVADEDVLPEALDVHFHSSFVRCFAMMRFLSSVGCSYPVMSENLSERTVVEKVDVKNLAN